MADSRLPRYYYKRKQLLKAYPRAMFYPSQRPNLLTLLPFKDWTLREVVELNFYFGQRVSFDIVPLT
jgi:hypothetical protein